MIEGGYVFEAKVYPSLTAIAGQITGSIGPDRDSSGYGEKTRLRCAIYNRKSTEEGLEQEFNSLDAQREACAAYIASQGGLGWKLVPEHYDNGGISGGTMERPALQRLLRDISERSTWWWSTRSTG